MAKPFALRELLARVRMRASEAGEHEAGDATTRLRVGTVAIDLLRHAVSVDGQPVELSPREFRLLEYLVRHQARVCTRDELMAEVWGYSPGPGSNVVDVTMRRLRAKLGSSDVIETVRNVGYCVG